MFAYCENDPVNKSDPTGEFWNIVVGAALGAGMEVLTQLATDTKLRDINWVGVAVQGAVGAVTSGTIPFRFLKTASKVVKATAKIAKNVVVSTAAEVFSQRNDKNKSIGKTATIGVQTSIDTLIDSGTTYLLRGTKAKIATAVVRTVQQAFSFTFGFTIEKLFSRNSIRYAGGR